MTSVSVTALDPDFSGNRMEAFDTAGRTVDSAPFAGDGRPGVFTTSTVTLTGDGIARVVLVPAPADFVAYKDLSFKPDISLQHLEASDPYPELLGPEGLTGDPERLAANIGNVTGVAADGATLVLLRATVSKPGEVVFSVEGGDTGRDGGVSADGSRRLAQVSVPVVQTSQGLRAFAFYKVPDEFGLSAGSPSATRSVQIRARLIPTNGSPMEKTLFLDLEPTPVVLVHGIWSSAARCWKDFPLLKDQTVQVTTGDYERTNGRHFAENRVLIEQFIQEALQKRRQRKIAVTRVDYAGHSMGGILGRLHTQLPYYRSPLNFGQGNIRKFFTLNTPHAGTPAAIVAFLLSNRPLFARLCRLGGKPIDEGAVEDLMSGSAAIASIGLTPLPAHALVGTGGSDLTHDVNTLSEVPGEIGFLFTAFKLFLGPLNDIFGGLPHDGLVDLPSQKGGMTTAFTLYSGPGSLHTNAPANGLYSDRLTELLRTPAESPIFGNFPAPGPPGFAARSTSLPLRDAAIPVEIEGALRIALPAGPNGLAGASLPIEVSGQNGFVPVRAAVLSSASSRLLESAPFATTLDIPQDTVGDVLVLAAGVDATGAVGYSDPVVLHVQAGAHLISLEAMDAAPILFGPEDSRQLGILGSYDDGVLRDVTSPTAGTTYASDDPGIVSVSASGLLTAVSPGETEIVVENAETSAIAVVDVTVLANRPPLAVAGPDQMVECSSPAGASVVLNGSVSSDPDANPLTFAWSGPFGTATDATPTVTLPPGTSPVRLTIDDGRGGSSSDTLDVIVRDTTAPVLGPATASPGSLWPPNHKMVTVAVRTNAWDACVATPSCAVQSVTANEPIDGDVEITGPLSLKLRSERAGGGSGRVYTLKIACRDDAGNTATTTATVTVQHDQGH